MVEKSDSDSVGVGHGRGRKKAAQIIAVTWEDAHGSDGTLAVHEIDHSPYVFTTVGYLVRSDDVGVSVASERGQDDKFRDITFIPRKMVLEESFISPKRSRKHEKISVNNPAV